MVRLYRRILAKRLERILLLSARQKGFTVGDGLAENIWLLESTIKTSCDNLRPLNLAFIDIKKAFDSVSHETLMKALLRVGMPPPLMGYIRYLYKNCATYIQVDGQLSPPVRVRRGVRQGDPLSCHLFNCVIDLALSNLDNEVGIHVWNLFLSEMAFADDMLLVATTPA